MFTKERITRKASVTRKVEWNKIKDTSGESDITLNEMIEQHYMTVTYSSIKQYTE